MPFEFEHKKRITVKNGGGDFEFAQKKRLSLTHPSQVNPAGYSGGAFDPLSFDVNSFWCGVVSASTFVFNRVNDFLFKHIASNK